MTNAEELLCLYRKIGVTLSETLTEMPMADDSRVDIKEYSQ